MKIPKVSEGYFVTLFVSVGLLLQGVVGQDSRNIPEDYGYGSHDDSYNNTSGSEFDLVDGQDKIWRGYDSPRQFPFYVAIMRRPANTNQAFDVACGGSLIDPSTVLSAAHCTIELNSDSDWEAWLAPYFTTQEPPQRIRIIQSITIGDPAYVPPPYIYNDIGVYKLERPANLNNQVNTICIGNYGGYDNIPVHLAGFGNTGCRNQGVYPTKLLYARGYTISAGRCSTTKDDRNKVNQVCAKLEDPEGGSNNAEQGQGDSGGPLFSVRNNRYTQVGLVSYNSAYENGCPISDYPGVYTIPARYSKFLRSNSNAQFC